MSEQYLHNKSILNKHTCSKRVTNRRYPFQEISGFLCEVGRQAELTLQDLVNRLFSVFTGERWLQRGKREEGGLRKRLPNYHSYVIAAH